MKSVEFEDYSERTRELKKYRKQLLEIINTFPEWERCETIKKTKEIYPKWNKEKPLVQVVQELGREIGDQTMDYSRPIKRINAMTFSDNEYRVLKALGYSEDAIAKALSKSRQQFNRYKIEHEFTFRERKVKKTKVV